MKLVIGNWKMNGSLASNTLLLGELVAKNLVNPTSHRLAVCVPYPYLAQTRTILQNTSICWGAQNVSQHPPGAYTGEVCAPMLQDFGCSYVIVGHSERRQWFAETSESVAIKAKKALECGITAIVCVGETLAERGASLERKIVMSQLEPLKSALGDKLREVVIAYEPVWAIGTGVVPSRKEIGEMHQFIKEQLGVSAARAMPVLYGGSLKASNAEEIFSIPGVDGGLVGGASLSADDFLTIARS